LTVPTTAKSPSRNVVLVHVGVTKRVIAAQDGPVILVGHSYGGAVISEAGNDAKVNGLVYIAAFAPDKGESVSSQTRSASWPSAWERRSSMSAAVTPCMSPSPMRSPG